MNKVIFIGRLTRDPELTKTTNSQVCRLSIAIDRPGKDAGADFPRIAVWGKQAETCDRYLSKGRQVAVEAHVQTGSYTDKEGKTVYTTDFIADRVEFLGAGGKVEKVEAKAERTDTFDNIEQEVPFDGAPEDDIPF